MAVKNPMGLDVDALMPKFKSVEEERYHRKKVLAGAYRIFAKFKFTEGVAGHITVRDPEHPDCFWLNPFSLSWNAIKMSDLIMVNEEGKIVKGKHHLLNQAAFAIHSEVHKARPDVIAAAHAHSLYGKTWSATGRTLDALTQDSCAFYEDHAVFDDYTGVVLDSSEGERIGKALGDKKAAILQNHGILTVGHTIEETVWWFISMERCCQSQILAESMNIPLIKIDHDTALNTRNNEVGFPFAGYFSFQPIWQDICREQPDFIDEPHPDEQ